MAQAFNSVDTLLAPFIKADDLSYQEVKQCVQSLIFGLNISSRWGCVPVSTQIATPSGFKYYNELNVGDAIYTFVDGKIRTARLQHILYKKNESGILHKYVGKNYVQTVTPEHRCVYYDETANTFKVMYSSELIKRNKIKVPYFNGDFESDEITLVDVERVEGAVYDDYVWCPTTEDGTAIYKDVDGNIFISGNSQPPFTNFSFDWTVPDDLAELNCIVGGKEVDFKYKDCKREMDMFNRAFMEVMMEGDSNGRGFSYPIPTYSITKDFDWDEEIPNNKLLFEMTAKYGIPYFSNFINSDMSPQDARSMCCRLRLSLRELRKKNGGYFGSGDNTGSVGVVTINLPRLAYNSKSEEDFYKGLEKLMDIAARSLDIKRKVVTQHFENGLYPYSKRYLKSFDDHFSTIATVGMNEACLNACWIRDTIASDIGHEFANNVLEFMRNKLSDYQEQYGCLFNLESAPAESTSGRFAMHDKKDYPDIITAGDSTEGEPYYTNSSNLPVGYTDDIFEALDHQDDLQTKYTGGTVFHAFLGEKLPDWKSAMKLTRKIAENYKLPYFTFSPTYSICPDHGYITGEHWECPTCGKPTEVYSRVTGYYRAVQNFNDGKAHEFRDRKEYVINSSAFSDTVDESTDFECEECSVPSVEDQKQDTVVSATKPILFTTATCPNCKMAKRFIEEAGFDCDIVLADENADLAKQYGVSQAPTLIVFNDGEPETIKNVSNIRKYLESLK